MLLTVTYPVVPKRNSVRASLVMDHFGISHDTSEHVLARDLEVPLQPGDVILFTGASGSGKSSLLRELIRQVEVQGSVKCQGTSDKPEGSEGIRPMAVLCPLSPASDISPAGEHIAGERDGVRGPHRSLRPPRPGPLPHSRVGSQSRADCGGEGAGTTGCCRSGNTPEGSPLGTCPLALAPSFPPLLLDLPTLPLGNQTLVDAIPLPFEEALQLLALCGLGEAPLLLRTPQELSEGQRYRFALALAVAQKPQWIVADEFTAVLDRTTAKVIAYNVRRIADRYGVGFLLATAQGDVEADLSPDLCVTCDLDGRVTVTRSSPSGSPLPLGEGLGVRAEPPDSVQGHSPLEDGRANVPVLPTSLNPQRSTLNAPPRKKKDHPSPSTATSGSAPPPAATGRTSLGGIIAVTTSG